MTDLTANPPEDKFSAARPRPGRRPAPATVVQLDGPNVSPVQQTMWWLPFGILVAGHLPFVCVELVNMWRRTHYQFFPFAFIAFFGLLWNRQQYGLQRPMTLGVLLLTDCVLLSAAVLTVSPWLAMVGLWFVCFAAANSRSDRITGRSLAYLAALPLLAVRLPANTDVLIVQRLQDFTSGSGSAIRDGHRRPSPDVNFGSRENYRSS